MLDNQVLVRLFEAGMVQLKLLKLEHVLLANGWHNFPFDVDLICAVIYQNLQNSSMNYDCLEPGVLCLSNGHPRPPKKGVGRLYITVTGSCNVTRTYPSDSWYALWFYLLVRIFNQVRLFICRCSQGWHWFCLQLGVQDSLSCIMYFAWHFNISDMNVDGTVKFQWQKWFRSQTRVPSWIYSCVRIT